MGRDRALTWALAVSLAVHLLLFAQFGGLAFQPLPEPDLPIEATLLRPVPPTPPPTPPPSRPPAAPPAAPVAPAPASPVQATEAAEVADAAEPPPAEQSAPVELPPDSLPAAAPPPALPVRPLLRPLAADLTLQYSVQTGAGFVAGRATYVWHGGGGRYALTGRLAATGITALFVTGEIVQSSEGWLDAAGLRPQEYWLQRGQRRMEVARFDWDERRLALEGGARADLADQAQDLMSLPFHLAMTAREGEGEFALGVTNGRKFNEFTFRQLGREGIEVGGRSLAALRLQGSRPGEGTLDIWLDLDGSGLPVRIRTTDRKGEVMELRLLGTESPAGNPS